MRSHKMPLTSRQREDLKSAVASFLKEIGSDEAYSVFVKESNVNNVSKTIIFIWKMAV